MAELMIAVVILGIGLLVTSSMFPIAWFKAREVAESAVVPSCADAAELHVKMLMQVNGPLGSTGPTGQPSDVVSAFFPGDWYPNKVMGDADPRKPSAASVYPDTRVHALNMGNYLAGTFETNELDPLDPAVDYVPVADNPWTLDDNLEPRLTDNLYLTGPNGFRELRYHLARIGPHARMFPPVEPGPADATPEAALWDEQFSARRYCWSVFYRFGEMPGPDGNNIIPGGDFVNQCITGGLSCNEAALETVRTLSEPRMLTLYYFTLNRPLNAKYARQEGFVFNSSGGSWDTNKRLDHPRALPPSVTPNVLLPAPWRFEATLLSPPAIDDVPTGVPSEIQVNDVVLADMLQVDTHLIDDRTGKVYLITQRRETASPSSVIFTLDKEYTAGDIYVADYEPFPPSSPPPSGLPAELLSAQNWWTYWNWQARGCDEDPTLSVCDEFREDEPERRFYWVFPPPVESVSADGVPVFDGSPPVVDVEVRQLIIAPRMQ